MRTSDYSDFDEALLAGSKQRNWVLVGLIISLALHGALCGYFYRTNFIPVSAVLAERAQTPTFTVKNVDTQPLDKAAAEQSNAAAKPDPDKTDVQLPDEKKSFDQLLDDVHASAALPDDTRDVLPENPQVDQSNANSVMAEIERSTAQTLSKSPNATREQNLMTDSATSGRPQPALTGTEMATSTTIKRPNVFTKLPGDSAGPNRGRSPGFSDLDSLLAQKGPLGSGTKPILLPENQTFGYNSADLERSAVDQLQKLGTLMKRNPKASFTIEGYTDSFGPAEYNLDLSHRRADAVKDYLVTAMGINPAQIEARGFGATKFLVPPRPVNDPSQEEAEIRRQQPNRRVVVVVHTGAP